jgi:hypothetical protein
MGRLRSPIGSTNLVRCRHPGSRPSAPQSHPTHAQRELTRRHKPGISLLHVSGDGPAGRRRVRPVHPVSFRRLGIAGRLHRDCKSVKGRVIGIFPGSYDSGVPPDRGGFVGEAPSNSVARVHGRSAGHGRAGRAGRRSRRSPQRRVPPPATPAAVLPRRTAALSISPADRGAGGPTLPERRPGLTGAAPQSSAAGHPGGELFGNPTA